MYFIHCAPLALICPSCLLTSLYSIVSTPLANRCSLLSCFHPLGGYPFLIHLVKRESRKSSLRGSTSTAAEHGCVNCPICQVATAKHFSFKNTSLQGPARGDTAFKFASPFVDLKGAEQITNEIEPDHCEECLSELGPGKHKECNRDVKLANLRKRLSPQSRAMLATDYIEEKIADGLLVSPELSFNMIED